MLKALGLNYYDSYVTHVTPSLTPSLYRSIKDPIKIPRTNGKLRASLESMRSAYECKMHQQDRFPAWQSWVEDVHEIREELKGYNHSFSLL